MKNRYITMSCPRCGGSNYGIDDSNIDMCNWTVYGSCTCNECGTTWEFTAPLYITDNDIDSNSIEYETDEYAERMHEWTQSR